MELVLERCTIRAWRPDDAASLAKHANNRRVWLGLRDLFPHPYTIEDANEFLRRATTEQPMTIFCIDVGQSAVGGIGIRIGQDVHRHVAELGFWLGEEFWGHGIMTEVIPAFVESCFEKFPVYRIYAEPYANNPASACVLGKAGFALEGRLKNNAFKDGNFWIHFSTPKQEIASLSRSISNVYRSGDEQARRQEHFDNGRIPGTGTRDGVAFRARRRGSFIARGTPR